MTTGKGAWLGIKGLALQQDRSSQVRERKASIKWPVLSFVVLRTSLGHGGLSPLLLTRGRRTRKRRRVATLQRGTPAHFSFDLAPANGDCRASRSPRRAGVAPGECIRRKEPTDAQVDRAA